VRHNGYTADAGTGGRGAGRRAGPYYSVKLRMTDDRSVAWRWRRFPSFHARTGSARYVSKQA